MKTIILIFITIILLLPFSGCKKYPEGPLISFRTIEKRIHGNWKVENYLVNGSDSINLLKNSYGDTINFDIATPGSGEGDNRILVYSQGNPYLDGIFYFTDDGNNIIFSFFISVDSVQIINLGPLNKYVHSEWKILKLSNKNMRLETNYENIYYKLIMKKI
jgi:hypothetical protein